jgi:ribonuclease T1
MTKHALGGAAAAGQCKGKRKLFAGLLMAALAFQGILPGVPVGWQAAAFGRDEVQRPGDFGRADGVEGAIARRQLPREALGTLNSIAAGGPYPYVKDGAVFGNYERHLPPHPRGYYHEYTVPTPGARNRGARRIVCGGPLTRTDNCFYSDDHYNSFKRIVE